MDIFEGIINLIIIKTKTYGNIKTSIIAIENVWDLKPLTKSFGNSYNPINKSVALQT